MFWPACWKTKSYRNILQHNFLNILRTFYAWCWDLSDTLTLKSTLCLHAVMTWDTCAVLSASQNVCYEKGLIVWFMLVLLSLILGCSRIPKPQLLHSSFKKNHIILTVLLFFLQTQNRMKLMADNYEDDHLKTAPDQTNHKPSPDQVA